MAKHLNMDDASPQVKDFFKQLQEGEYVLEMAGRPVVGIVPPWQVEKLSQERQEILLLLCQSWERNRTLSAEEVEQTVEEAIQEVRRESRQNPS